MDHVLQETERNRQMANQIAYKTFTAHGFDNGVFPSGPKAWESLGIRIHGCLLSCEGSAFCSTCKDDPFVYHGARYKIPFSRESPHFEVLIQETGERRLLGVGVVEEGCGCHSFPGWLQGSVGYHVDDGRIFDVSNCTKGIENEDAMAYRGDLIGCTVDFDSAEDGKVPIVFSLNGRRITQRKIWMEYIENEKFLYPYIGMGQAGIRVLAKMSLHRDVDKGFKIPEFQDGSQLDVEELDSILKALEKIGDKLGLNFQKTVNGIGDIHQEMRHGDQRFTELVDDILFCFKKFETQISYEIEMSKTKGFVPKPFFGRDVALNEDDKAHRQDIIDLCEMDKKLLNPTNSALLNEIKEKTKELEKMSDDKFSLVFKAIQKIKESQQHYQQQDNLKAEEVRKTFNEHEEFIRTNLPIPQ